MARHRRGRSGAGEEGARPRVVVAGLGCGLFAVGLALGAVLTVSLRAGPPEAPADDGPNEIRSGATGLVNPLLECREGDRPSRALVPFRKEIDAVVARHTSSARVFRASVYFRDLDNGPWFQAGDDRPYRIGSLLKVPLLIGYLKRAEADPEILEKRLVYSGEADPGEQQNLAPARSLEPGEYTVWELLERAIIYSDNEAAAVLARDDGGESLETVRRLADFPSFRDGTLHLTPRHFTAMFRILYNASYLNVASSQRALELLVRTEFRDGLVAGLPAGVEVANKFGERIDDGMALLHDCGIVYHPSRPYLLCVMTEGRRLQDLALLIADVSRAAYEAVSRQLTPRADGSLPDLGSGHG